MLLAQQPDTLKAQLDQYPGDTIAALFAAQASRTPNAIALIAGNYRITYQELDQRSDALAAHLQSLGVGPEKLVGIAMERSVTLLVSLLAILKAGGAYVPLDPSYPADRLAWIIEDSGISILLTTAETRLDIPSNLTGLQLLLADQIGSLTSHPIPKPLAVAKDLAYVIYTSGSTGRPKGVMIEHRNVINLFKGFDLVLGSRSGVWLAVTSISFDISVLELFWTLARGFTVVLSRGKDSDDLADAIMRFHITHLQMTPTLARMLILNAEAFAAIGSIRQILLGGEAVPASLIRKLRERYDGQIFNVYGPTETTVWSTAHPVAEVGTTVSIGRPILNTEIHLLDAQQKRVPYGELGELYIGGNGVARGYWNRPDLTSERFLTLPAISGTRLYRTGDLARYLPDGNIDFVGRSDYQIKLRGHRIEPAEIEFALEQCPGIRQAVVLLREDHGGPRLVAFLISAGEASDVGAGSPLRRDLESRLPEFMIPTRFVWIDSFPLTSNGKIDRKSLRDLPTPDPNPAPSKQDIRDAASLLESEIAAIWCDALGVSSVGLYQNFFDLGAHSLTVAEVYAALKDRLHVEISLVDLFQFSTVASLAAHIAGVPTFPNNGQNRAQRRRAVRRN
jgi:amino acid adenylation domain-containing protein